MLIFFSNFFYNILDKGVVMAFGNSYVGGFGAGGMTPRTLRRPMGGGGGFLGRIQQMPNMYGQPQQVPMDPMAVGQEIDPALLEDENMPQNPMMANQFGGLQRPFGMGRAGFGGKLRPQFRNMGRFGNITGQGPGMPQQLPGQMAQNKPIPGRRPLPRPGGGNMPMNQGGGYL